MGTDAGAVGAVLYSKKDGLVQNITDVSGKRVGVGIVLGSYQLGMQVLRSKAVAALLSTDSSSTIFSFC
jgi:hypothetical protein